MSNVEVMGKIKMNVKQIVKRIIKYKGNDDYYYNQFQKVSQQLEYLKKHIDAKDIKKETGYERKQQIELVKFVADFLKSIENIDIKPFLIGGSLIGQYRHGGFIPWDDDMDFGLIREEYERLVDYCKNKYSYYIYDKKDGNLQRWIDECTKCNAGKYILFLYDNQIQISYGTNVLDRKCVDFFSYDYYSEVLPFSRYSQYIDDINRKLKNSELSIKDKYEIVRQERISNKFCVEHSTRIYFGLDNMETFLRMFNEEWIKENEIFPLVKRNFEGYEFWTPHDVEAFLRYEYPDYNKIPDDVGIKKHSYWDQYIENSYVNIEFYLVDAFEIANFLPFYKLFRNAGAHAIFVAEPPAINVAGNWFDYEKALEILQNECLEYREKCNENAQLAFTTQDAKNLSHYSKRTKRVNCSYGYGLIRNSYAFTKRVVEGFDYKLCNGHFQQIILEKLCSPNTELFNIGIPKYYGVARLEKSVIIDQLNIHTQKPILVYLPTWDECCCVGTFYKEFLELGEKYYIITKLHHVLERMDEYRSIRTQIREFSDLVIESTYSLADIITIADLIIADAKSGASLESIYINEDASALFLSNSSDIETVYFDEIHEVAPIVISGEKIANVLNNCNWKSFKESRKKMIEECFGKKDENYAKSCADVLMAKAQLDEK